MLLTYLCILLSIYVIYRSFTELMYLLLHGDLPQKNVLINYINKLQGKEKRKSSLVQLKQKLFPSQNDVKQNVWGMVIISLACMLFGFLLFQNLTFAIVSGAIGLFYPRIMFKRSQEKQREAFILQFRDAMISISNSLKAGNSLQTAFIRCHYDLSKQLQKQKLKPILSELEKLNQDFQFGVHVDEALERFKERNPYEEVQQFIDATLITKSKGGKLTEVIENITNMITDKITVQQEIKLATAQKRMEARILTFFPLLLVLFIMLLNPAYLEPMYQSWLGTSMLFLAMVMLIINYFFAKKITDIEI
jgi:tight adherence protein B